jgi:hypothetical protein
MERIVPAWDERPSETPIDVSQLKLRWVKTRQQYLAAIKEADLGNYVSLFDLARLHTPSET